MSSIIDAIQRVIKPYNRYIVVIFLVIVFILFSIFLYYKYVSPKLETSKFQDVVNESNRNKNANAVIYFFHVDWCPHCIKAKPEWNAFSEKYNGQTVNGYKLTTVDIDCTDDGKGDSKLQDIIHKNNIKSYPTVKLSIEGRETIEFDSKINERSLEQFINSVLNN